jgi:hypothetical protein
VSAPIPEPGPATQRAMQPATQPATQPPTQPAMEPPTDPAMAPVPPSPRARGGILIAVAVGTLVAVGIGVYGRLHEPTLFAINVAGFSSGIAAKAWLASLAFVLALVQLVSAMIMYGRFPRITAPSWIGGLHRWSGRVAVLVTVPVAVHCLYALGFQYGEPRVLVHSLCGCLFYGAFVAKMLVLTRPGTPRWSLPVLGGLLFTALVTLWLTSSVWFFSTSGLTF